MSQFNIRIQPTNNENIVKFIADSFLTESRSYEFGNIEEAAPSPLAQQLFYLPFVKTVYISRDFVAIEKYNIVTWEEVQNEVAESIATYLNSGQAVISEEKEPQRIPVTVYAESTPNPSVMKFVANKPLVEGMFEFKNIDDAAQAPLAKELFGFPFVKEVFLSANYVSIAKYDVAEWQDITMELREFVRNYLESGETVLNEQFQAKTDQNGAILPENDQKLSDFDKEIISILDEYVKPAVAGDGGHIAFESFNPDTKTVRVVLQGACSGCPSSTVTLKNGIETMLREMLQGRVQNVEAING